MKKKLLSVIMTVLTVCLVFSAFAGCSDREYQDYLKRTEIKIMGWNFGTEKQDTINRKMVKAFEANNPKYRVTILDVVDGYDARLLSDAGTGKLADVFMINSLPTALSHKLCLELTAIAEADEDWAKIPKPIEEAARFNGRVFAVPAAMHLSGLFVNDTVFENANIDKLEINPTYASFKSAVEKLSRPTNKIASLNNETSLLDWYPASLNKDLGWYTYDGDKFNLSSENSEFEKAMDEMQDIRTRKLSYDSWTEEERKATGAADVQDLFQKNGLAMYYGATYERNGLYYGKNVGGEPVFQGKLRYVGTPGGRNAIIPDFFGISAATEQKDMAYKLAKWMSFDTAGTMKKIELDTKGDFVSLPLTNDKEVLDAYFEKETVAGVRTGLKGVYATLDNGIVEGVKSVPGYLYCRWKLPTGLDYAITENGEKTQRANAEIGMYFDDIWLGKTADTLSVNIVEINKKINQSLANARRALDLDYPKK